jgi:hypothetical protein
MRINRTKGIYVTLGLFVTKKILMNIFIFIWYQLVFFYSEEVFDFSSGQMTQAKAKYTAVQIMDETIPDADFSIIGNIHICITTNDHK